MESQGRRLRLAGVLVTLGFLPSLLTAQICSGQPGFVDSRFRLFGGLTLGPWQSYHGGLVMGGRRVFAWLDAGMTTYGRDQSWDYGVGVGVQLPQSAPKLQICPAIFAGVTSASRVGGTTLSYDALDISGGADIGYSLARGRESQIITTMSVRLVSGWTRWSFVSGGHRTDPSDAHGIVSAGLGFQLSEEASLSPSVAVPIDMEGGNTLYSIVFSVRFVRY
jgi:hypothetical protein